MNEFRFASAIYWKHNFKKDLHYSFILADFKQLLPFMGNENAALA